jgi:predicted AlkP superfamily phosphohydrolase/phosphomutase
VEVDVAGDRFRLAVIGLDSVSPDLLYRRFAEDTPRLQELLRRSTRATLRTCDPPITVPAWAVMFSGVDPGTLGLYGFRHRRPGSYDKMYTPSSSTPRAPMVWNTLSRLGKRVAVLGMPPGYPPPALNGVAVGDFLTPEGAEDWVTPARYREVLRTESGGPFFDISFRAEDRHRIQAQLLEMTHRRWKAARYLWRSDQWDLFVVHDIGPDRLHHAFWKFFDEHHPRYRPASEFADAGRTFYRALDREVGEFLDLLPDDVRVMVASDHGSQAMEACFCVNDWLIQREYLSLRRPPQRPAIPLEEADVDWSRTSVWAAGGYYARFFLNVRGREPEGVVAREEVPGVVDRLREDLQRVHRPDGSRLEVRLFAPSEVYRNVEGDPPDLMAYFDDARIRSAGTIGHPQLFLEENDTGPDDAVHSFDGILGWREAASGDGREIGTQQILDVAPTILRRFGVNLPTYIQGSPITALLER